MFGVEYDLDLFPFWARYYLDMKLDSYKVFLHKEDGKIGGDIKSEFKNAGFTIECIDGPQSNGILRKLLLGYYASQLPPDDFLVTADADEFQRNPSYGNPETPPDYRRLLVNYDIITGFLVDRYSIRLEACHNDPFEQYPEEEPFTRDTYKNFTPPFLRKTEWSQTRRNKILAAHCGDEVSYAGSHCLMSVPATARIAEDFRVMHFAWRDSAKAKLSVKTYFTPENLNEIYEGKVPESEAVYHSLHRDPQPVPV